MSTNHTHEELLTRANKVRAAVMDRDIERLRREVQALLDAFLEHVDAAGGPLLDLPVSVAKSVNRGQKRVLKRLSALSVASRKAEVGPECDDLGRELTTLLALQAEEERRAAGRNGSSSLTGVS